METDWRLKHLQTQPYLRGLRLKRVQYRQYSPQWDHDHCAGCWTTFAEYDLPDEEVQHEGYTTCADYVLGAEYDWICVRCFTDFNEAMGWSETTED